MHDSIKRYHDAGLNAEYHWWDRETALAMLKELHAELEAAPKDARLTCRPGLRPADDPTEPGAVTLWLSVEHEGAVLETHTGFNDSHPCPPFCGDGG